MRLTKKRFTWEYSHYDSTGEIYDWSRSYNACLITDYLQKWELKEWCDELNKIVDENNQLRKENEQLKSVVNEVIELLSEEVDVFSDKATEHDINAYIELNELDNKDAYYMATATKKAIKLLKGVVDD